MTVSINRKSRDIYDPIVERVFNFDSDPKLGNDGESRLTSVNIEVDQYQKRSADSEPFEEEIFYDVRREDRICAQCGQDHSFKSNFNGVKTSIEWIPELIPLIFKEDLMKNV